MLSHELELLLL